LAALAGVSAAATMSFVGRALANFYVIESRSGILASRRIECGVVAPLGQAQQLHCERHKAPSGEGCGPFSPILLASMSERGPGHLASFCTEQSGLWVEAGAEAQRVHAYRLWPGQFAYADGFECEAKRKGVRCVNEARHGFFLQKNHNFRF